jgi:hypothetical protein
MTFSNQTAPAGADRCAGPGFAAQPLPADEMPILAFWYRQFWRARNADDPTNIENWERQPLSEIERGGTTFDLRQEGSYGRVLCIGASSRRTVDLAEGTMLVLCHTTGKLTVKDIRST